MRTMDRPEKRKHKRLGAKFDISCRRIGSQTSEIHEGRTTNISSGGVYFQTTANTFKRGDLLKVELLIPPTSNLLECGGKMEGFAKVLRTDSYFDPTENDRSSDSSHGIALQFCRPPKLCV